MSIDATTLKNIIEGALLAAGKPLNIRQLQSLFEGDDDVPNKTALEQAITQLSADLEGRGIELKQVSSGYRLQVRQSYGHWVGRLWEERPQKYSRAMLETLALIAYRQPITRGEIEDIRGVAVSSNIIRALSERDWVRVVGHKDVPGRPAMYATSRTFLDYFNLENLDQLPSLSEIRDLEAVAKELQFDAEIVLEARAMEQRELDYQQQQQDVQDQQVDDHIPPVSVEPLAQESNLSPDDKHDEGNEARIRDGAVLPAESDQTNNGVSSEPVEPKPEFDELDILASVADLDIDDDENDQSAGIEASSAIEYASFSVAGDDDIDVADGVEEQQSELALLAEVLDEDAVDPSEDV
ncbi:Segregation and condensation protein B [Sinobacterium norvegicum]|uniref:Segregation and condensation protein B n=1 Tax=Sinobacterium norvegicum TaxID=1641715 RepID=A0ABM9AB96_9GAMM|nr:SMC-Scp complex subunit ScpB [Sinobacterium norvegicum]CAH0990458.1 Segregation and condensation protein B [Sinobacterium norvegicum]